MSRPLRVEFEGAHYHVMNRGFGGLVLFDDDSDYRRLLALLEDIHTRWQVLIYAYCCMNTHYHILLQTPQGNLSRVMRHLDGLYAQRFNHMRGRGGPLFRGRYKAILVDADAYLLQVVRYIHLNPVEAGLVTDPTAYAWSSHRLYGTVSAPGWLARHEILSQFSSIETFEDFVSQGNDEKLMDFYRRRRWSPFLGREGFLEWALAKVRRSPEHPRMQTTPQFPTLDALVNVLSRRCDVPPESLRLSRRGLTNMPRRLAIFTASRVAGFPHREIKRYFALGSASAVTRACQRMETLLSQRPELRQLISPNTP